LSPDRFELETLFRLAHTSLASTALWLEAWERSGAEIRSGDSEDKQLAESLRMALFLGPRALEIASDIVVRRKVLAEFKAGEVDGPLVESVVPLLLSVATPKEWQSVIQLSATHPDQLIRGTFSAA